MNPFSDSRKPSPGTSNDDHDDHRHLVVFDTMIDERRQLPVSSSPMANIGRQNTGDRPQQNQQYLLHSLKASSPSSSSSPSSWAKNAKTFFQVSRKQESDDDALYWCE